MGYGKSIILYKKSLTYIIYYHIIRIVGQGLTKRRGKLNENYLL